LIRRERSGEAGDKGGNKGETREKGGMCKTHKRGRKRGGRENEREVERQEGVR
jgi:hypothetical protein